MHIENLNSDDIHEGLEAGQFRLVDVREMNEVAMGYIDGAVIMPLSVFDPAALPADDGRELVFYCAGGVRSVRAIELAQDAGLKVSKHLAGGIRAWIMDGYEVVAD